MSFESFFRVLILSLKFLWCKLLFFILRPCRYGPSSCFVVALRVLSYFLMLLFCILKSLTKVPSESSLAKLLLVKCLCSSIEWLLKGIALRLRSKPSLESPIKSVHHSFILPVYRTTSSFNSNICFRNATIASAHFTHVIFSNLIGYLKVIK